MQADPAVTPSSASPAAAQTNGGFVFMSLKPLSERKISADQVIRAAARKLAQVPGASLFLQAVQDIRVGGRAANAQYQFTLQADTVDELYTWAPKILAELQRVPELADVNSDQQNKRARDRHHDRPRHRGPARHHRRARSTTRSMTHSVSARSRPSTTPATSITW